MSTPVMVAVAAGAVLLGAPVLIGSATLVAGARAANAADAAALAAADAMFGLLPESLDPCEISAELVVAHGGDLQQCEIDEGAAVARIRVGVRAGLLTVTREARAGPPG